MLKRWIARACIGLALLGGGLSASLSWAQTHTEQAVWGYVNVTLPAIARMKPFIDKSASDRARAFDTMGLTDTTCDASVTEAITAREHFAEGASNLCGAMIAWMNDEDIDTCSRVKLSGIDFAHTEAVDPTIAKLHASEGIVATRLQLQKAAGCAEKTVTYWGPKLIGLYDQLSATVNKMGDLVAPPSGGTAPTQKAFKYTVFQCHLAYNADEKTKSAVVAAADDGCYAMNYLLDHKLLEACQTLDGSIFKAVSMGASDPLSSEAEPLMSKLAKRFGSLDCGMVIATAKVEEDKSKAMKQAAARVASATPAPPTSASAPSVSSAYVEKANSLVAMINTQTRLYTSLSDEASQLYDRGDTGAACEKFQLALTTLRSLAGSYWELGTHTGDQSHFAEEDRLRARAIDLRDGDYPGGVCSKYGSSLR